MVKGSIFLMGKVGRLLKGIPLGDRNGLLGPSLRVRLIPHCEVHLNSLIGKVHTRDPKMDSGTSLRRIVLGNPLEEVGQVDFDGAFSGVSHWSVFRFPIIISP